MRPAGGDATTVGGAPAPITPDGLSTDMTTPGGGPLPTTPDGLNPDPTH
jgi:hypothetical protein